MDIPLVVIIIALAILLVIPTSFASTNSEFFALVFSFVVQMLWNVAGLFFSLR